MEMEERLKLGLALAIVIFMLLLMPSVHADDFYCVNCSDCNAKIQNATSGDVVMLTANITNCDGNCIEFGGKDGITFDGRGHVIDGTGNIGDTGLYLSANSNDNTIKNCTIREFYTGIKIDNSRDNTVTDVVSKDNDNGGVYLNHADYNDLTNVSASGNKYSGNTYGFKLRYSDHNNLANVTAEDTKGSSAYGGFYLERSNNNNFTDLIASDNSRYGIYIYWDSNDNRIRNATITTNEGQGGLYVYSHSGQSTKNDIDTSNTINGKPIQFFDNYYKACPNNQVLDYNDTYSLIHFYNGYNITLYATTLEDGVFLWSTHNSKIYDVNASHGLEGIRVWHSSSNTFTNITTSHNANSGFYIDGVSNYNNFINITSSYNVNGIYANTANNNIFTNIIARNNDEDGFYIRHSNSNTFNNVTASNNGDDGIEFVFNSDHNTVNNSHIECNSGAGVYFYYGHWADDNLFYNNYLNNANNFDSNGTVNQNNWNTSKRSGTNIISGSWLGGNYWATPSGTGFSEMCTDTDGDGICDDPYNLATNNIDYLPLTKPKAPPRTIYVNETGWWIEPDQINPSFTPIQSAVTNANVGDTIIVHDGTYNENVDVSKQLTIQSANGSANCIVNALDPNDHVFNVAANYVNLSGFTVTDATGNGIAGIYLNTVSLCNISNNNASYNQRGIYLLSSSGNTLTVNTASNNIRDGISLSSASNSNNLTGNTVNTNGEDGIHLQSSTDNQLMGNIVSDNNEFGICMDESSNNTLTGNTANENAWSGFFILGGSSNTLTGNTANSNNDYGIHVESASGNLIYNNYFDNTNNAQDDGTNVWNTTKEWGENIIGGPYMGGNYWGDYAGVDNNGDGLGDTMRPYASSGNIQQGGDWHPLTEVSTSLPDLKITDIWVCWPDNCTICYNVTNVGTGTAHEGQNTSLLVDGTEVAYDCITEALSNNESYIGCFDYIWVYTPLEDNITVCADCNNTVSEGNESNNFRTKKWICGDSNEDGSVDTTDVIAVWDCYTVGTHLKNNWAADTALNNGVIDTNDVIAIWNNYVSGSVLNCSCSS